MIAIRPFDFLLKGNKYYEYYTESSSNISLKCYSKGNTCK